MGRSATLCGGKPPPLWTAILEHRVTLTTNLQKYLSEEACVEGAPVSGKGLDEYRDEVARAYASAIRLEASATASPLTNYGTTISFAVVYSELWSLATELSAGHPKTTPFELRSEVGSRLGNRISTEALKAFNASVTQLAEMNAAERLHAFSCGTRRPTRRLPRR